MSLGCAGESTSLSAVIQRACRSGYFFAGLIFRFRFSISCRLMVSMLVVSTLTFNPYSIFEENLGGGRSAVICLSVLP